MQHERISPFAFNTWKVQQDEVSSVWRDWLWHAGSFMQRLAQHGVNDARIQIQRQCWQLPEEEERKLLNLDFRTYVFIREVLILSLGNEWMFARTVLPQTTLTGSLKKLAYLKNRSLGSVLFRDPALQRSEFIITLLRPALKWHAKVVQSVGRSLPDLWARRSMFTLHSKSLLLTEVFLPDIAKLCILQERNPTFP